MTNEEINRAVAESVSASFGCLVVIVKDYCNDLNAMHEAVCKLPDGEPRDCYLRELQIVTQTWEKVDNDDDDDWLWHSANATARQRAEAYLRTVGKWSEA